MTIKKTTKPKAKARAKAVDNFVYISKKNEVYMKIDCGALESVAYDIRNKFSFKADNVQFDPRFKSGKWDGFVRLYDMRKKTLYIGLLLDLCDFLDKTGVPYRVDPELLSMDSHIDSETLDIICEDIVPLSAGGNPIGLHPHQREAIITAFEMQRATMLAATSAGKSLIIYMIIRIFQLMQLEKPEEEQKKVMVIVPSSALVDQMYNDFADYSETDTLWHVHNECQRIRQKMSKVIQSNVIISTWQSAAKMTKHEIDDEIGCVIVDECHTARGQVLKSILAELVSVPYRFGFTGTLDHVESNEYTIQGLLGPAVKIIKAKELMQSGAATDVKILAVKLNHSKEEVKALEERKQYMRNNDYTPAEIYQAEMSYIESSSARTKFIADICESYDGNTLVLYNHIDHGEAIAKTLRACAQDVFEINGKVDINDREKTRGALENSDNVNLVASYGTCSTGISIKRLHNLVLAAPTK